MNAFDKFQRLLVSLLIGIACFYGGYYIGQRGYVFEVRKNPPNIKIINRYPGDSEVDFALFWDVWDMLQENYLERPIDPQKMLHGAISGMVESLDDPYTSFLAPETNAAVSASLNGKFEYQGIGAELGLRDGQLIIVAPLDGSPAKRAGVKAGDKILAIEGVSTIGITITEAVAQIRGESGTTSNLTIQTGDSAPREVPIKRGVISIPSVSWEDKGDGIAYIKVSSFGAETNSLWSDAVSAINVRMRELDAVIVDVRGNPGGYLQSAVFLSEEFFRNEPVLYEETATGETMPYEAQRVGAFKDIPALYVLVDGGSASASEILAAALRSHADAVLVGEKTFGKGTIQDARDFEDGSGIHITVAKWLTPEKEWVHEKGIEPDIVVELTDDDINDGKDPQLDKAIELAEEI
jgi:carboxyl-terminal processing protease